MDSGDASKAEAGTGDRPQETAVPVTVMATRETSDEQLLAGMDPSHLWQQIADITVQGALFKEIGLGFNSLNHLISVQKVWSSVPVGNISQCHLF